MFNIFESFLILFSTNSIKACDTDISESIAIIDNKLDDHIKYDGMRIDE
jgi:hypothetical protein